MFNFRINNHSKFIDAMRIKFLTKDNQIKKDVDAIIQEFESHNELSVFTSGSTGLPKKITHEKEAIIFSAENTIDYFNWHKETRALLCLSTNTIGGKMMIIRSMVAQSTLIVGEVSSNPLKDIDEKIDFIAIVPYQLEAVLEESKDKLKEIPYILVGGGAISSKLEEKLIQEKLTVYQSFGMTETISHIALKKVGFNSSHHFEVLQGIEISTDNNQLVINSSALNISNLKTNDIVKIVDDNHFDWIGRSDFVINSGGVKIHPELVESKLKHVILAPFYVSSLPHSKLGEQVILVINSNSSIVTKKDLETVLTKYEIPKEIYLLPEFKWTESGKINRLQTNNSLEDGIRTVL